MIDFLCVGHELQQRNAFVCSKFYKRQMKNSPATAWHFQTAHFHGVSFIIPHLN